MAGHDWWGTPMRKHVGFYEYGLSPYHLRPFKGFLNPGSFLLLRRTALQLAYIAPPAVIFYSIAVWADKQYELSRRKAGSPAVSH
eukprot:jgi/Hompol1/1455/HPOL_005598-RA